MTEGEGENSLEGLDLRDVVVDEVAVVSFGRVCLEGCDLRGLDDGGDCVEEVSLGWFRRTGF